jgi:hypothetical protein
MYFLDDINRDLLDIFQHGDGSHTKISATESV